jgi:hypothetical protein
VLEVALQQDVVELGAVTTFVLDFTALSGLVLLLLLFLLFAAFSLLLLFRPLELLGIAGGELSEDLVECLGGVLVGVFAVEGVFLVLGRVLGGFVDLLDEIEDLAGGSLELVGLLKVPVLELAELALGDLLARTEALGGKLVDRTEEGDLFLGVRLTEAVGANREVLTELLLSLGVT